jgi:hypothetical protein
MSTSQPRSSTTALPTLLDQGLGRIEELLSRKTQLLDDYSKMWARYASREMLEMHRQLEIAQIRERIRVATEAAGLEAKKTELDDMVRLDPAYRTLESSLLEGRARWVRCQQEMTTIDLRLRLELARIRLYSDTSSDAEPLDLGE